MNRGREPRVIVPGAFYARAVARPNARRRHGRSACLFHATPVESSCSPLKKDANTLPSWKSVPEKSCDRSSPRVRAGRADHGRRRRTGRSAAAPLRSAESELIEALAGGPFEWLVPERAVIERLAENEETAVAAIAWMKFQGKPAARGRCAAAAVEKRCLLRSTALDRVRKLGQCHCVLEACRHLRDLERGARANAVVGRDLHRPNVFRVTSVASSAMPSTNSPAFISTISVHTPQRWLADGAQGSSFNDVLDAQFIVDR